MAHIRKRESKKGARYMAVVRREGYSRTATFRTKSEAVKWAKKIEVAIDQGKHLPPAESKRKTVRNLIERYKETVIPRQKDQVNPTRHANFWIDRLGDLKLNRLNRAVLVEVRDELAKEKAPSTVNRYLALISHACTLAEREWEWMESNPVRKVGRLHRAWQSGGCGYSRQPGRVRSGSGLDSAAFPVSLSQFTVHRPASAWAGPGHVVQRRSRFRVRGPRCLTEGSLSGIWRSGRP